MASLKNIKLKIHSVKKTATVTRAMEAVSAVKMRKSQERALGSRAYAAAALSVLERLSSTTDVSHHPLMQQREGKVALVVITSDKGLAGALNGAVIRRVERELLERNLSAEHTVLIGIGRRGAEFFANRGYEVRIRHENVSDGISEEEIQKVTNELLHWHAAGEISSCIVVHQSFISTFEQQPSVREILPLSASAMRAIVASIRPVKGKYASHNSDNQYVPASYTIEPDADAVLSQLLPKLLNIALFHALLENKASEHSARMVAMKSATDKAKEMAHNLTRKFNKIRQAAITREVSEITSGIEAMK